MIETERLFLRPFKEADVAPFAALNADPRAMEHLMGPVPIEETRAMVGRIRAHHASRGFGVGGRGARRGSVRGLRGADDAAVRRELHAVRRDPVARRGRALGEGLREGSC